MTALHIALLNLRRVARDRTALFFMLALPMIITLLIGVSIFEAGAEGMRVGVVSSEGALAQELIEEFDKSEAVQTDEYASEELVRRAVRREEVLGAIILPHSFDADLRAGKGVKAELVVNSASNTQVIVRDTFATAVSRVSSLARAAQFAMAQSGGTFEENYQTARQLQEESELVSVESRQVGEDTADFPGGFSYTAPANLVLAVFLSSMAAAAMLIETRRLGLSRRMLAAPTSARTILLGELLGRFFIAVAQATIILVLGTFAFGVDYGHPVGAFLLLLLVSLAATAIAMLVGAVFRTPEQASALGPFIGIGLGMLSGCMWPLEIVSPTMRAIGHAFPQAWAMDGFIKLIARGAGPAGIALELLVLAGFTAVILPLAALRFRRAITA